MFYTVKETVIVRAEPKIQCIVYHIFGRARTKTLDIFASPINKLQCVVRVSVCIKVSFGTALECFACECVIVLRGSETARRFIVSAWKRFVSRINHRGL